MAVLLYRDPTSGDMVPLTGGTYWVAWTGTQAQYDALPSYDPMTLYVIV